LSSEEDGEKAAVTPLRKRDKVWLAIAIAVFVALFIFIFVVGLDFLGI
jgi:hypothetical protein